MLLRVMIANGMIEPPSAQVILLGMLSRVMIGTRLFLFTALITDHKV